MDLTVYKAVFCIFNLGHIKLTDFSLVAFQFWTVFFFFLKGYQKVMQALNLVKLVYWKVAISAEDSLMSYIQ